MKPRIHPIFHFYIYTDQEGFEDDLLKDVIFSNDWKLQEKVCVRKNYSFTISTCEGIKTSYSNSIFHYVRLYLQLPKKKGCLDSFLNSKDIVSIVNEMSNAMRAILEQYNETEIIFSNALVMDELKKALNEYFKLDKRMSFLGVLQLEDTLYSCIQENLCDTVYQVSNTDETFSIYDVYDFLDVEYGTPLHEEDFRSYIYSNYSYL